MQVKFFAHWSYSPDVRTVNRYVPGQIAELEGRALTLALEGKAASPWQEPDEIQVPAEDLRGDDEPEQRAIAAAPENKALEARRRGRPRAS